jgi:hypothetical protein
VGEAVVAAADARPVGDVGQDAGFPGLEVVDVAVGVVAGGEAAVSSVADSYGPPLGGVPVPGFAAQVERFAAVADTVGDVAGVTADHGRVGGVEGGLVQVGEAAAAVARHDVDQIPVVAGGVTVVGRGQSDVDHVHEGIGPAGGVAWSMGASGGRASAGGESSAEDWSTAGVSSTGHESSAEDSSTGLGR